MAATEREGEAADRAAMRWRSKATSQPHVGGTAAQVLSHAHLAYARLYYMTAGASSPSSTRNVANVTFVILEQ